jgi:hypothetical protein
VRVFFDSSAPVKRYVREKGTGEVLARCDQATELAVATIAWPELVSAFRRLVRENRLDETRYRALKADPAADLAYAVLCEISPQVVQRAITALEAHPLRAMDALHVAAALVGTADTFVPADALGLEAVQV